MIPGVGGEIKPFYSQQFLLISITLGQGPAGVPGPSGLPARLLRQLWRRLRPRHPAGGLPLAGQVLQCHREVQVRSRAQGKNTFLATGFLRSHSMLITTFF